ncbi:hypothetical protein B7P34_08400 [Streptosporangium nondiastaticum]|uniref:Uncharacterized protein n=1 Tax=Streptosporangium nondiastaticum TaxID=35764 RepID=A0A9X7JT13_9ACTN|nr:hypothetical protein B7P34_08400 [Streptosporangium nondiastaticum]
MTTEAAAQPVTSARTYPATHDAALRRAHEQGTDALGRPGPAVAAGLMVECRAWSWVQGSAGDRMHVSWGCG